MNEEEIKEMTLDLAKVVSYLNELQKANNQNYVTPEGIAFLEGVLLSGNKEVRIMPYRKPIKKRSWYKIF